MTLLIGSNGSMGKRYQAILKFLRRPFVCADIEHDEAFIRDEMERASGVIIATPTQTHAKFIRLLAPFKKPILCEKPVVTNVEELTVLLKEVSDAGAPFMMMNQYRLLAPKDTIGGSFYDYFRHGSDGMVWDCMQIIGLARGAVSIRGDSPVWRCMINGRAINIRDMDAAYVEYVRRWFLNPYQSHEQIIQTHQKTADFERTFLHG